MQAVLPRRTPRFTLPGAWMSAFLAMVLLLNLALSLSSAGWTDGLSVLAPVVFGGFLLGTAMSFSRWGGLFPVLHSLVTGLAWVLSWVSRAPQIPAELVGSERLLYIGNSLWNWILLLFGDSPARSNLVFILELSVLMWWLGYLAAWAIFREGKVWRAIVPIGLVMMVNMYFGPDSLRLYLALYVVFALLLAVRSNLAEQELTWRYSKVRYASDIQFDFLRDGLIFALVVMVLSLFTPNAASSGALSEALSPLQEPWEQVQEEWGRLFSSLNYQSGGLRPVFGDTLTLGGARELGDTLIMDVRASSGRYWRAVAYDTYTGRRWLNTDTKIQYVDFGSHVQVPEYAARREVTQTITTYYPAGGVLFAAPQPLRVSLKAEADLDLVQEGQEGELPVAEVSMLRRRGQALESGDTYLVVSSLTSADIESLQEASTDYPAWIEARYLEVPESLPARVGELARQVTADAPTAFDKALALEQFLRGYEYNDQIAAPPPGVDGVDYFLFDVRAGYCDYYASAFAMMARTLGIPARVSAGYSQGEYVPEQDVYRVRERNGHSWPEVFFPDYGWVEFEPTASEEEIVRVHRPEETEQEAGPIPTLDPNQTEEEERFGEQPQTGDDATPPDAGAGMVSFSGPGWWIGLVGMMLLVGAVAFLMLRPSAQRSRRALVDPELALRLYGRLVHWAGRLGLNLRPSQTPNEHAAVLAGVVPEGRSAILTITDLYVREQFSPYEPDERAVEGAMFAWNDLQPVFQRAWILKRLGPLARLVKRR